MILLSSRTAAPSEPVVQGPDVDVAPLSWRYTAPGGDAWELTDWESPVIKLKGAQVATPTFEHWWQDAQQIDGSSWGGGRAARGSLFLPLMVRGSSSRNWLEENSRFVRTLDPRQEGVVRVSRPDGEWRELVVRYESGAEWTIETDPAKSRSYTYGITWAAGDPYWRGEPVSRRFPYESSPAFLPGPPFTLGGVAVLGRANVTNPGDEVAFPQWRVVAPFTDFKVGVGASFVRIVQSKASGWIDIDMRPDMLTITDEAGVSRWEWATDADFEPIPAGQNVPLTVDIGGANVGSEATLQFVPRYRGPFT